MNRKWAALAGAAALSAILTGCSEDPGISTPIKPPANSSPATIINMPDGFTTVAFTCFRGNGVYEIFHTDKGTGSVSVVSHDSACA